MPVTSKTVSEFVQERKALEVRNLIAHILALLMAEQDGTLVSLKTNKSDLIDPSWLNLKKVYSNTGRIVALMKKVKFVA